MSQNLVINGNTYNDVESVAFQNENGEKVVYTDDPGGSVVYVNITENEDGTYSADKTTAELTEAYNSGCAIFAVFLNDVNNYGVLPLLNASLEKDSEYFLFSAVFEETSVSIWLSKNYDTGLDEVTLNLVPLGGGEGNALEPLTINGTAYDGSEAVSIDTRDFVFNVTGNQEDGYTSDTPFENFVSPYLTGRNLVCHFCGEFFTDFYVPLVAINDGELLFGVSPMSGVAIFVAVGSDGVYAEETFADMRINGEVWDLTASIDFTDTINDMIDEKLGVIENGSY